MNSVFPQLSLDREVSRWEEHLHVTTPVELHDRLYLKRDDYFAPLGYGGVNGAKVRQLVWLVHEYAQRQPNGGLILAGSVKSPQLGRVAAVGKHFGLPVHLMLGSSVEKALKANENVRIAATLGAQFWKARAPYNPALQAAARKLQERPEFQHFYRLEYGLSVEGTPARIESFYRFASEQVRNIPDEVTTLLMPAGSCNATIALLYGLARFPPKSLERIVLIGVGPERINYFEERLRFIEQQTGIRLAGLFTRSYPHHPVLQQRWQTRAPGRYRLEHYDLHGTGWATYQDEMPDSWDGVALHPTYEGKMLRYIRQRTELYQTLTTGTTLFWIVGSEPKLEPMMRHL